MNANGNISNSDRCCSNDGSNIVLETRSFLQVARSRAAAHRVVSAFSDSCIIVIVIAFSDCLYYTIIITGVGCSDFLTVSGFYERSKSVHMYGSLTGRDDGYTVRAGGRHASIVGRVLQFAAGGGKSASGCWVGTHSQYPSAGQKIVG